MSVGNELHWWECLVVYGGTVVRIGANMTYAQVRFVAAYFGVISRVTINGSVRELRRDVHVAPGDHWEITDAGLWCCSRSWKRLVLYPFDEAERG